MSIQLMIAFARFGVLTAEFHHWLWVLKSPAMMACWGNGILLTALSSVLSSLSGVCDFSL